LERSRVIAKTNFDLKNKMKIVEQRAIGLEVIVEQMEALDKEKVLIG
jgi:hypothetical protein